MLSLFTVLIVVCDHKKISGVKFFLVMMHVFQSIECISANLNSQNKMQRIQLFKGH